MENKNFSSFNSGESGENLESLHSRSANQARGEEANRIAREKYDQILKEEAELEAILASAPLNAEPKEPEQTDFSPREEAKEIKEKSEFVPVSPAEVAKNAKSNPNFRKTITRFAIGAIALLGTTGVGATIANALSGGGPVNQDKTPQPKAMTEVSTPIEVENNMEVSGIIDGYDKEGMWTDAEKPNTVAFSNFKEVLEMHDGNVKESMKYVATNEVEALSDYVSGMPDKVKPAGFQGLTLAETNKKIESMSPEDYDKLHQEFNNIIDKADKVENVTLNGKYSNAFEANKAGDELRGSKAALENGDVINHETMQLISCTTNEKDTEAFKLSWTEDGQTYSMLIKAPCAQVVETSTGRLSGLPEAVETSLTGGGPITIITGGGPTPKPTPEPTPTPTPKPTPTPEPTPTPTPEPTPTPTPTPEPTPTPDPEWGKSGDPNAGSDYKQTIVDNPAVPNVADTNEGNRGYVDDNKATPGSSSESNGVNENTGFADSGIVAEGANTEGGRLSGGEDQSDGQMAGENAYHSQESIEEGQKADEAGNTAQEEAQENNDVGGDNNSDSEEESRVAEGDF